MVPPTLELTVHTPGVPSVLTLAPSPPGATGHVELDDTTGVITLGTLPPDHAHRDPRTGAAAPGLRAGATVRATYAHYTGLIAEVQRVVSGDPDERLRYPGWKAAGTRVRVPAWR